MNILLLPSWYKEYPGHVLGSFFEEQGRALMKKGNSVGLIFYVFHPLSKVFKKKRKQTGYYDDNGLQTYVFNLQSYIFKSRDLNTVYSEYRTDKYFRDYVKRFGKPDILHAHSVFSGGQMGIFLSKKYNIPLVITEHLTHYVTGSLTVDYDLPIAAKIFAEADRSLVVGNVFKAELVKSLNVKEETFEVVHNMVADIFFKNASVKKYVKGEEFIFFTNSFMNPRKNHKLMFDALKKLIDKGYKVRLVVGGYGETETDLKNYVKEKNISGFIDFTGQLSRQQVKEQLDKCHAFLLASTYETFGVVLIESLACGRPVISTDSGGPRDIINSSNGILTKDFESSTFSDAMEHIINQYDEYDQKKISTDCFNAFSEEKIAEELIHIYEEVIEQRKLNQQ